MRYKYTIFILLMTLNVLGQSDFRMNNKKHKVMLPFQSVNNLIFINVKINGEQLKFLLDTGVEQTVLFSLDDKKQLKLNRMEQLKLKGLGTNQAIDAYRSSGNKIEIGDLVNEDQEIYIILDQEFNFSSRLGIPVNGIIGYSFFKKYLIEINYGHSKITVHDPNYKNIRKKIQRKYKATAITIEENKPYCITVINANNRLLPSKLLIDTGNSDALWVFLNQSTQIKLPEKYIEDFLGRGLNGNIYGKRGRLTDFEFGDKIFKEPLVTFPDSTSLQNLNLVPDRIGSVGGEVISKFDVVFDYENKRLYTKPNAKIDDPFHFNMSGVEVEHTGLEWVEEAYADKDKHAIKVYSTSDDEKAQSDLKFRFSLKPVFAIARVRPNSEAEKAGLKPGDKILKINNRDAHGYTIEKINQLLKSGEGKIIQIQVERDTKIYDFKFQLKSII